jgi:hypothetical protein
MTDTPDDIPSRPDISPETVERLANDMQQHMPWGRGANTLRAQAARIAELEAALATARADALEQAAVLLESKAYFTAQELDKMSDIMKKQEAATIREDRKISRHAAEIRALKEKART